MPKLEVEDETVLLANLKIYMCAICNLSFKWMSDPKENGEISLEKAAISKIHARFVRLHQNRKDFVMRTKNEHYTTQKIERNLLEAEPTFTPTINKRKTNEKSAKRREEDILDKGKEYQQKRLQLAK